MSPMARPSLAPRLARSALGRSAVGARDAVVEALDIVMLGYAAVKSAFVEGRRGRSLVVKSTITQVYFTAVEPLPVFILVGMICGFVAIVLCDSLMRPNGLAPHIPTVIALSVVRELIPLLIALFVIGRSGPAIATELGYMRVNHEIEALDLSGINTDYYVVLPRLLGVTIGTVGLTVVVSFVALFGGFAVARALDLVSVALDLDQILQKIGLFTMAYALGKAALFGSVISVVNSFHGLAVQRSYTEIPRANVRGAVGCFLVCFFFNAVISIYALGSA
jgi:phospholipid/cholesterol/gamma-HCH transport system permease protein